MSYHDIRVYFCMSNKTWHNVSIMIWQSRDSLSARLSYVNCLRQIPCHRFNLKCIYHQLVIQTLTFLRTFFDLSSLEKRSKLAFDLTFWGLKQIACDFTDIFKLFFVNGNWCILTPHFFERGWRRIMFLFTGQHIMPRCVFVLSNELLY